MGFAGTFLSKKFPAPSKISLRPHIPCASGNRLCNVYGNRYRIYVLKSMQERFYSAKFEKTNLNDITYNFVPKNAMKLRFDKSFTRFFSKNRGVLGQRPKVFFLCVYFKDIIFSYSPCSNKKIK